MKENRRSCKTVNFLKADTGQTNYFVNHSHRSFVTTHPLPVTNLRLSSTTLSSDHPSPTITRNPSPIVFSLDYSSPSPSPVAHPPPSSTYKPIITKNQPLVDHSSRRSGKRSKVSGLSHVHHISIIILFPSTSNVYYAPLTSQTYSSIIYHISCLVYNYSSFPIYHYPSSFISHHPSVTLHHHHIH